MHEIPVAGKQWFSGKNSPKNPCVWGYVSETKTHGFPVTRKIPLECHASRMRLSSETHGKKHRLPVAIFLGFQPEFHSQNSSKPSHNTFILHLWIQTCQNTLQYITYSPILIKLQLNTSKTHFQEKFTTKYNHTPFLNLHKECTAATNHFGGVLLPPTTAPNHINTIKLYLNSQAFEILD